MTNPSLLPRPEASDATPSARGFRSLVERQWEDLRGDALLADLHAQYRTRLGIVRRDAGHRDGLAQGRRMRAARGHARRSGPGEDRVAMARDPAPRDRHAAKPLARRIAPHPRQRLAAHEV